MRVLHATLAKCTSYDRVGCGGWQSRLDFFRQ
jgi:hypothetical protein